MNTASLTESLFALPIEERITLADRLYASVPGYFSRDADQAWLEEAERRDAEMDSDPDAILTEEQFRAELAAIRSKK